MKKTVPYITNLKNSRVVSMMTAYDYPSAKAVSEAEIDIILVGDSLAQVILGHDDTLSVTMDEMLHHVKAVTNAKPSSLVVADMPYMSYQISNEEAIRNAGEFIQAGMDAVKVEGCMVERIKSICDSGIMVMSHLGLTPHTRAKLGGYRVQGKTADQTNIILEQALKLQDAGCSFLLLEAMPRESAAMIAESLDIPVYGIGAGDKVDGQLVIMHDLIGLFWEFKSKFVKRYCEAGQLIQSALTDYVNEVRDLQFPAQENFYEIKDDELEKLLGNSKWKYEKES